MTQTVESLFETGLERYKNGTDAAELIPVFQEICDRAPENSAAWTCLSWLYMLSSKPKPAYKAAQKAVKLNPQDPQARINMAAAMLETGQKGLRNHVEIASQLMLANQEWHDEIKSSIEDGLNRKPDWKSLAKIKGWLFD